MIDVVKNILAVGFGSFIGGAGRYLISVAMKGVAGGFPWATMVVNLLGCFLIGLFTGYFNKNATDGGTIMLFLTYGICGGFTTFSTFSRESLVMLQGGNYLGALCYIGVSVVVGIFLAACGYMLAQ